MTDKTACSSLQEASLTPSNGLEEFLLALGKGEKGFGGTEFADGKLSLGEHLTYLVEQPDPAKTPNIEFPRLRFGYSTSQKPWLVCYECSIT